MSSAPSGDIFADRSAASTGNAGVGASGRIPTGRPPSTLLQRAIHDTFTKPGAIAGAIWIGLLALAGCFAPFIANSHPLAMKVAGRWSFPIFRSLAPNDIVLPCVVFLVIGMWVARARFSTLLLVLVVELVVVVPLARYFCDPPGTVVYERYRELEASGRVERIYRTIIPFSPNDRLRDQPQKRLTGPSREHWIGTETSGADLLSRIIHASRIALAIGFISQGIAVVIGVFVGGIMGYYVGKVDLFGMRVIEIFEAIPRLFLLMALAAYQERPDIYLMMAIIGLTGWTGEARFIRGEFFKLRKQDFVQAAIAMGLPTRSVLFRHMLPNGIAPVLVSSTFGVATAILIESTLSFLGLGLKDDPSWGEMLNQARAGGVSFFWWIAIFPGLAIFLTVFAYILIGESLRDALDPKLHRSE